MVVVFGVVVFLISSVLGGCRTLLLVVPPLVDLLGLVGKLGRECLIVLFDSMLVVSGLTNYDAPVNSFPTLFLLSGNRVSFTDCFTGAAPFTMLTTVIVVVSTAAFCGLGPVSVSPRSRGLSITCAMGVCEGVRVR